MDLDASQKYILLIFMCKLLKMKHSLITRGAIAYLKSSIIVYDGEKWLELATGEDL